MNLVYRMYTEEDEPALMRLWSEHSGWDSLDAEVWRHVLLKPPAGAACITVAVDTDQENRIVGQFAFIPLHLMLGSQEVPALRPFAPILAKGMRTSLENPLRHPVMAMYQYAISTMRQQGFQIVYTMPDPLWARMLRLLPSFHHDTFPLYSLPLPLAEPFAIDPAFTVAPLTSYDEEVDRLWEKARCHHGCTLKRDARVLQWKVGSGHYSVLGVRRNGSLEGLTASRRKGDRQWLLCDMLSADTGASLRATLSAACNLAHQASLAPESENPVRKAAILTPPSLEPLVKELGFKRDAYDFHLIVQILDSSVSKSQIHPSQWYISAND